MHPIRTAEDRSMAVPADRIVKTARVEMHRIRLACREPMSTSDVEQARQRLLCLGDQDAWPCPVGEWQDGWFALVDGRHAYLAALMLGRERLLVAWLTRE